MTANKKIKAINKSFKTKLNISKTNKLLRFQLYCQEMLVNMNFKTTNIKKQYQVLDKAFE